MGKMKNDWMDRMTGEQWMFQCGTEFVIVTEYGENDWLVEYRVAYGGVVQVTSEERYTHRGMAFQAAKSVCSNEVDGIDPLDEDD